MKNIVLHWPIYILKSDWLGSKICFLVTSWISLLSYNHIDCNTIGEIFLMGTLWLLFYLIIPQHFLNFQIHHLDTQRNERHIKIPIIVLLRHLEDIMSLKWSLSPIKKNVYVSVPFVNLGPITQTDYNSCNKVLDLCPKTDLWLLVKSVPV